MVVEKDVASVARSDILDPEEPPPVDTGQEEELLEEPDSEGDDVAEPDKTGALGPGDSPGDAEQSDEESEEGESDDDASFNTAPGYTAAGSTGSHDTNVPAANLDGTRESYFDSQEQCMCRLSQKVNGEVVLCGWPRLTCPRRTHRGRPIDAPQRGSSGWYLTAWNAGKAILDAVESMLISDEDHQAAKVANSQALKLLAITQGSANKARAEVAASLKQSMVTLDSNVIVETINADSDEEVDEATSPPKTPRQDLISRMARAAETLKEDGFVPQPVGTPSPAPQVPKKASFGPPPPPSVPSSSSSSAMNSEVSTLLRRLIQKFDNMATTQESVLKTQDLLARTTAKQETERETLRETIPRREPLIAPSTSCRRKKTRFYAVAKGRQTGIFTQWAEVVRSVSGYSGALTKTFREYDRAEEWLYKHTPRGHLRG
jgi:hypothetical protein